MDQLSNVLQIHSHQQASHPHYQYLDNILISSSKQPTPPPHPPTHQDSPHQPQQDKKPRPPDETPKCPRCDSANTKFCYYNNYSLTQPRYFCKSCRRYWTKGGTLRNVPVGGGCRKNNKRSSSSSSSSSPSSPSSSLTSPSTLIKRTLLASSSHREFELDQQQPHHQMMMMMMMMGGGGGDGGGNTNNTNSGAPHPTSTSGILHLPVSYDQDTSSCDLMNMAFARFQQRITHQGDQFGERESIELDTTTIGNGVVTTSSIDSIIPRSHQNQGSGGGGGDQSFMDSFRDGITYVNDHHQHPQQQQSLNNNQPDTTNNNYNGGMNSFFHHNLNFLSYGLPAADENAHQNISGVSNDDKTEGLLSYDELNALNGGNTTTTTTTHSAAVTTSGAMKHEPLWGWTDQTKLPLGFPWQQVMKGNDGVGDEVGEKNWINVNGRMMNIGGLQVGMDY